MSELNEKLKASIERLRSMEGIADRHAFDGTQGYYLAFSGGKDSVAVKAVMDMAGVKYDAHYRVTSVDPPEVVRFIKEKYPGVGFDYPRRTDGSRITMWNLIREKRYPPTRSGRYCCEYLKEDGGDGRFTVTGVRWAESRNRELNQGIVTIRGKQTLADHPDFRSAPKGGSILVNDNDESRSIVDACVTRHKTCLNPIIDWTDDEVWEFIRAEKIPYCGLYDEGFSRIGCIGCPMAQREYREREFIRWPKYRTAYIKTFDRMLEARREWHETHPAKPVWRQHGAEYEDATAKDVFNWWMEYDVLPGQYNMFEESEVDYG